MIREVESYKISILGETYTLVSDEGQEAVLKIALHVDRLMKEIADKTQSSDPKKIAVFTALKLAGQLKELEDQIAKKDKEESHLVDYINRELASL